ncbi:MAG: dihydropteroate synthase [Myxococcales bacterium]|nr:MAG: dihydropteroate synthase [Myxococcales bacterium]
MYPVVYLTNAASTSNLGILNITPDSFSDGGAFLRPEDALARAKQMLSEGADVIDVGGESSRPAGGDYGEGSTQVDEAEELRRVIPVIRALRSELGATISIDTVKAQVAQQALEAGASIVNDVSCAANDELLSLVAEKQVHYVLMHNRADGKVAGENASYSHVAAQVCDELQQGVERCLSKGIEQNKLWLDPGLGFAKSAEATVDILAKLTDVVSLGYPVLLGHSRKSFIARVSADANGKKPEPSRRMSAGAVVTAWGYWAGAQAIRTHDVFETRQAMCMASALSERLDVERMLLQ